MNWTGALSFLFLSSRSAPQHAWSAKPGSASDGTDYSTW